MWMKLVAELRWLWRELDAGALDLTLAVHGYAPLTARAWAVIGVLWAFVAAFVAVLALVEPLRDWLWTLAR